MILLLRYTKSVKFSIFVPFKVMGSFGLVLTFMVLVLVLLIFRSICPAVFTRWLFSSCMSVSVG